MVQRGEIATLNLVLKADVHGSLEALTDALRKLDQEHDEVRLSFVHRARRRDHRVRHQPRRGRRTRRSSASTCARTARPARSPSPSRSSMRLYEVIYKVLDDVNKALLGMLKPEYEEVVTGDAEVREIFSVPRARQGRRLLRAQRGHHPRLEGPLPARGHDHLEGLDRVAAPVQGRRPRGPRGLRVRHRPRELPGPQGRRRHRDLRGARDRRGDAARGSGLGLRRCDNGHRARRRGPLRSPRAGEPVAEGEARRDPADRRRAPPPVQGVGGRGRPPGHSGSGPRSASRWSTAARRHLQEVLASVERFVAAAPDVELLDIETAWLETDHDAGASRPASTRAPRGSTRSCARRSPTSSSGCPTRGSAS